jgi:hypothetical protein
LPKAPLSPLPVARRDKGVAILPYWRGDHDAPTRIGCLQKAAGEPPRAHILVAAGEAGTFLELQRLLARAGYRVVGPAATSAAANRLIERSRQRLSCGLLDVDLGDSASIADHLSARGVPIVWLASAANPVLPIAHAAAPVVCKPFSRDDLTGTIETSIRRSQASRSLYVTPPPQAAWPRIFRSFSGGEPWGGVAHFCRGCRPRGGSFGGRAG